MNELAIPSQNMTIPASPASSSDPKPAGRLIVLVPPDLEFSPVIQRIWELATETGMNVQLLGLCRDAAEEPGMHRSLVTMSALLQDQRVPVEVKTTVGNNWLSALKQRCEAQDMIVCFAEQRSGLFSRPLSEIIQAQFETPLYLLYGYYPQKQFSWNWIKPLSAWVGSLGVIGGSFLLQAQITTHLAGAAQSLLLTFSVLAELWLLWGWNSLLQ